MQKNDHFLDFPEMSFIALKGFDAEEINFSM